MNGRFDIKLTDAARDAARQLEEEGMAIRFTVARSGCCSMAVSIYPDTERITDERKKRKKEYGKPEGVRPL